MIETTTYSVNKQKQMQNTGKKRDCSQVKRLSVNQSGKK